MKTLILTLACCLAALNPILGTNTSHRPQSDNYQKGVEALNNGNPEEAYKYLNNEITENPDNGYAHCYMALVCNFYGDYQLAIHAANTSVELIPEDDNEYQSFAHYTRGTLLMHAKAYTLAEKDLNEAIRRTPEDAENYKTRAEIYLNCGAYDASLADLQMALKLDSHADVYNLMMQLLEMNPDPGFLDKVTASYQDATASK